MHLQLGEIFAIVVSSPEYAKDVMKTYDVIFASRPKFLFSEIVTYNCTDIAFSPYGNYWKQLRRISTSELFTPKQHDDDQPHRRSDFNNVCNHFKGCVGSKCKDQEEFIGIAKEVAMIGAGFDIGEFFPSSKWIQLLSALRPKLERLRRKDLVDVLLKFVDDGNGINQDISLTMDNIKAIILILFTAGGETSATTIDWVMAEMIKNPRVMQKAQEEVREIFNKIGRVDETCIKEL
ncbi:hypothetical protein PIB30_056250, partial [Stylosanthes scabra]|nr:hypothetical protein [Stylosanthes scabra]